LDCHQVTLTFRRPRIPLVVFAPNLIISIDLISETTRKNRKNTDNDFENHFYSAIFGFTRLLQHFWLKVEYTKPAISQPKMALP
jgi:hypothetical protein